MTTDDILLLVKAGFTKEDITGFTTAKPAEVKPEEVTITQPEEKPFDIRGGDPTPPVSATKHFVGGVQWPPPTDQVGRPVAVPYEKKPPSRRMAAEAFLLCP